MEGRLGSCNNGFGDTGIYSATEASNSSMGVHYELVATNNTDIVRTISPSASATVTNPATHMSVAAQASVYVKYTYVPIRLTLTGVTSANDHSILVGQNLGAQIDTGGLPLGTGSTYDWSVSGAEPFQDYIVHVTSELFMVDTPDSAEVIGFTNQHTPTLSTYLKKGEEFTVSCGFYGAWMGQPLSLFDAGRQ